MGRYIVRKLLIATPALIAVAAVVGLMGPPLDIDPCRGEADRLGVTREDSLCLAWDTGVPRLEVAGRATQQYLAWVTGALHGDLGGSLDSGRAVNERIARAAPVSVQLALMSMGVTALTAVLLGTISAMQYGKWPDHLARLLALAGRSIPDFIAATVAFFALLAWVGWLPSLEYPAPWERPQALLAPALIVGWRVGAISARTARAAVLDALRQDYVLTARAQGLTEQSILVRHALPNALLPVLRDMANQLPALLGGVLIVEVVFGLPGVGRLGFGAIQAGDFPVIQGVLFVSAVTVIGAKLGVDIACAALDPRIRYA